MEKFGLVIPTDDEPLAVFDTGCDNSLINLNSFIVGNYLGVRYNLRGALEGMTRSETLELANHCFTKIVCKDSEFIGVVNQCLVDPNPDQLETLLQPHQLRASGILLDDIPPCHLRIDNKPGTLCLKAGETTVPLYFDGLKTYIICVRPTEEELHSLPHVVLTSEEPYEPRTRLYTRRVYSGTFGPVKFRRKHSEPSIEQWQAILGYCSKDVVKETLKNTTRHIKTLDMETHEYMRDYAKSRTNPLRPYRINDILFTDTFFSTIRSIRGNTCFQVFALKRTMYSVVTPMKAERFVYGAYEDFITNVGAANAVVSDNANVYKSEKWKEINRRVHTQIRFTVPYHQSSNFAELIGGKFKYGLVKLFHYTPQAPYVYWDFGIEYMSLVDHFLSKRKLKGRCAASYLRGETVDISIFRFPWFCPIWYYAPNLDFPTDRMKPGFFLGIEPTTGDGFSYIIVEGEKYEDIPLRNVRPIVRSIVRSRSLEDTVPPRVERDAEENLIFTDANDVPLASNDVSEEELYEAITASEADIVEYSDPRSDVYQNSEFDDGILLTTTFNPPDDPDQIEDSDDETIPDDGNVIPDDDISMASETEYPNLILRTASSEDSDDDDKDETNDTPAEVQEEVTEPIPPSEETTTLPVSIRIENSYGEEGPVYISQNDNDADEEDPNIDSIGEPHLTKMNIATAHSVNVTQDPFTDITDEIRGHRWCGKTLELECLYHTGEIEWHPFDLVYSDNSNDLANYLADRKCKLGQSAQAQTFKRWARSHKRAIRRMFKKVIRSNVFRYYSGVHHGTNKKRRSKRIRRAARAKFEDEQSEEAKAWVDQTLNARKVRKFEYGVEVPRNWEDVLRIDMENGNTAWQDAIKKEIGALLALECFDPQEEGYRPPEDYQYVRMHLVYAVKVDLRKKARLVCDGSRVDPRGLTTRATVVKGISVRLLDLIASHWNKKILTGDIGNAFVQSTTEEKVYTKLGPEFGPDLAGRIALIVKALYGLTTSAAAFRKAFANFLRSLGFKPTRYDRDVWLKPCPSGNGYDYICTHVDDFKIIADDPQAYIDMISGAFFIKESGDPEYYLGNDYKLIEDFQCWTYNAETYEVEAIRKVEEMFDEDLKKVKTPLLVEDFHPECDDSPLLKLKEHRQYQCMIGMLQWLHTIARPELGPSLATFNRFGTCPREEHLRLLKRVFAYLN